MRAEFINPFVSATQNVFQTMLGKSLVRGPLSLAQNHTPVHEVSGLIGLTGQCQGMVIVNIGRDTAMSAAGIMLGETMTEMNADVVDAIGELTNMIAGAAKAQLEAFQLNIGLPTVITGSNNQVSFPSKSPTITIPFESDIGPVSVEVGLAETPG